MRRFQLPGSDRTRGHVVTALCLLLSTFAAPRPGSAAANPEGDERPSTPGVPDIETFMQIGFVKDPEITADGETLFFVSGMTGTDQIFRLVDGGWPYQLTVFEDGVDFYAPSPDGRWIVVGASAGGNEQSQLYLMNSRSGALRQLTDDPDVKHVSPLWTEDGTAVFYSSNEANGRDMHIYRRDVPYGEPEVVFEAEGWNIPSDVDSRGRLAAMAYESSTKSDIYLIDLESGRAENVTENDGEYRYWGGFTRDENVLFMLTNHNEAGLLKPAYYDPARREITRFFRADTPWEVEGGDLSPNRDYAAFIFNENGYGKLVLYDLVHDRALPVPPLEGLVTDVRLADSGKAAISFASATRAPDIWVWDWRSLELEKATHSTYAGVDPGLFIEPDLVEYEGFDGRRIPAFLYLPRDYEGGPLPFIIHVHGGPASQFRPSFSRHFNYLLLNGFGVLAPNIRGSKGYGREYLKLDDYRNRTDAVKDVGSAARWLIEKGYTTPEMLGIKGTSYGGYMTLAALASYPELFAAGCDISGIANYETFLENTAEYRRELREEEYGPLSDPEFLREISPLTHSDRIRAALLVVHGVNDPRVPVSEARQIVRALSARGAPVDTLIFQNEGHGVAKLENRLTLYRRMVDFFRAMLTGSKAERSGM